ncbi:MAG: hypothetical protein HC911_07160 [Chloroflexaceae bacterium]|nr:hypothetical protein [Chloroflexaceae bacterium]
MTQPDATSDLALVVSRLATWLQSMRGPHGYTGPVPHWWQSSLHYTGIGIDWRYEGIITGYLHLYRASDNAHWLARACQAADDIARAQLPDGSLQASSFERNPLPNGTPHEAACALALLRLVVVLQAVADLRWQGYLAVAGRIIGRQLSRLWDASVRAVRDDPDVPSFVPNKAATLAEAIILLAQISHSPTLISDYAVPILDTIIAHQLPDTADPRYVGAIYQNSFGSQPVPKFFPLYIARCIPALALGTQVTGEPRYQRAALQALAFVLRWRTPDVRFPQVVYPHQRVNRYPQWIAAVGDILHAIQLLAPERPDLRAASQAWLVRGQLPSGGIRTAHGFAAQISQRTPPAPPDLRDLLPVCGWNDKAFAYLTSQLMPQAAQAVRDDLPLEPSTHACQLRGVLGTYEEDQQQLSFRQGARMLYLWRKGAAVPDVCDPVLYLK